MIRLALTIAALALAACQTAPPPVPAGGAGEARLPEETMLTTERQEYRAGEPVRLTLTNRTDGALGVNLCLSTLERREGQQWAEVRDATDEVCPMILRMLEPGGTETHEFRLRPGLAPGEYRFRTRVERMGDGADETLVSAPFTIRG